MTQELGAMLSRLLRVVVEHEAPILERHGITMWEHVVLGAIRSAPGANQNELAQRSGRDSTRLIAHLDALEQRGLVSREPDPADRRRRVVRLTGRGETLADAVSIDIRAMEEELLGSLDAAAREALRGSLSEVLGEC